MKRALDMGKFGGMGTRGREINDYIGQFSGLVKKRLELMRKTIEAVQLPGTIESTLAYQMPTYKLNGNLVHFEKYVWAKGSVQFPHTQPLPVDLIKKIVRFRLQENISRTMAKPSCGGQPYLKIDR